jgi:hypothetical protein
MRSRGWDSEEMVQTPLGNCSINTRMCWAGVRDLLSFMPFLASARYPVQPRTTQGPDHANVLFSTNDSPEKVTGSMR